MVNFDKHFSYLCNMFILRNLLHIIKRRRRNSLAKHFLNDLVYRIPGAPFLDICLLNLIILHPERHCQKPLVSDHPWHFHNLITELLIQFLVAACENYPAVLSPVSIIGRDGRISIPCPLRYLTRLEIPHICILKACHHRVNQ